MIYLYKRGAQGAGDPPTAAAEGKPQAGENTGMPSDAPSFFYH